MGVGCGSIVRVTTSGSGTASVTEDLPSMCLGHCHVMVFRVSPLPPHSEGQGRPPQHSVSFLGAGGVASSNPDCSVTSVTDLHHGLHPVLGLKQAGSPLEQMWCPQELALCCLGQDTWFPAGPAAPGAGAQVCRRCLHWLPVLLYLVKPHPHTSKT